MMKDEQLKFVGKWEQILLEQEKELAKAENELKEKIEHQKLRDQFAGQAMQAFLLNIKNVVPAENLNKKQAICVMAYETADEMMKARTK